MLAYNLSAKAEHAAPHKSDENPAHSWHYESMPDYERTALFSLGLNGHHPAQSDQTLLAEDFGLSELEGSAMNDRESIAESLTTHLAGQTHD